MSKTRDEKSGVVYLVGAGSGDPGLLTLRGAELLAMADVVIYDHLANPALLSHAPKAKAIYVGKQSAAHTLSQEEINQLLVKEAQAGACVVRLKGGDPFVFGRGGEECQALAEAGIPFEVVPGVTAAIAASAYAGIPITHRDFNNSFTLITGHEQEGREDGIDWATIARLPCLAFYMGLKSLPHICANLIEHGKDPATPAASIQWGTTPRQRTVVGTVGDLPEKVAAAGLGPPAITIIGKVVSLRPTLNWFEKRPLFGQTIVVTRTRQQASDLSRKLTALGAGVIEAPTIELAPPSDWKSVDQALQSAHARDWIVFTSANGVQYTRQRLLELGKDARAFGAAKIAVIGEATAAAVREQLFLQVDLCPRQFVAEALADEFMSRNEVAGRRFLLLRADIARPVLVEKLRAAGAAEVEDVTVYQTQPAANLPNGLATALDAGQINWITFASGGTARNFIALLGPDYRRRLQGVKIASIGPITTAALEELGVAPTVSARTFTIDGLVEAIQSAQSPL
jgi:uroporphyrinogen III methyltransferase/synthase